MDLEVETLEAVVAAATSAAGTDTVELFGASLGAAVAARFAATYPDSVSRLVLYGGWVRGRDVAIGREPRTRPRPDQPSSGDSAPTYWPTSSLPAPTRGRARRSSTTSARPPARRPRATCSRWRTTSTSPTTSPRSRRRRSWSTATVTGPHHWSRAARWRPASRREARGARGSGPPALHRRRRRVGHEHPSVPRTPGRAAQRRRPALTDRQQQVARLVTAGPDEPRDRRRADHHRTLRRVARRAHPRSPRVPVALPGRGLVHRRWSLGKCGNSTADTARTGGKAGGMQTLLSSLASRVYSGCAYAAFVAASVWGVLFLADLGPLPTVDSNRSAATGWAVVIDLGLLLVFAVQHTVMARDPFKQWLTRVVPRRSGAQHLRAGRQPGHGVDVLAVAGAAGERVGPPTPAVGPARLARLRRRLGDRDRGDVHDRPLGVPRAAAGRLAARTTVLVGLGVASLAVLPGCGTR